MTKLNDFEFKVWLQRWGIYFPEVDIFKVDITYYNSRGNECNKYEYEKEEYDGTIAYKVSAEYQKGEYLVFEFLAHKHQLLDEDVEDILSSAYGVYYTKLNKIRYDFRY